MIEGRNKAGMTWPEMLVLCLIIVVAGLIISSAIIRSVDDPLLEAPVVTHPPKLEIPVVLKESYVLQKDPPNSEVPITPAITAHVPVAKISKKDAEKQSYTAIHIAVETEIPNVVQMVAGKDQKINQPSLSGITPLGLASRQGNLEIVEILLQAGADVNIGMSVGHSPILEAVKNNSTLMVARLLKAGADIKSVDQTGLPLIHIAAENGCEPMLKLLVKNGMSPNLAVPNTHKFYANKTPLDFALGSGKMEAVEYLMSQGAMRSSDKQ